ncbi:MAG: GNAT family N-acetyltransferase [Anaerofustis stercorihominis]|nr:GNAT family N-acetyltransferase [Anaerofustis stercorihominis]
MIRKATVDDINAVTCIYEDIHTLEEEGKSTIGWIRGIYPTKETAEKSVDNDELFVMEVDGIIVASARINKIQDEMYAEGKWEYPAENEKVMVMHTLVVSPSHRSKGYAKAFAAFYEQYARENGCISLRIDTNEKNTTARNLYKTLGYKEIGIVSCEFNGIKGVNLVLLEKPL